MTYINLGKDVNLTSPFRDVWRYVFEHEDASVDTFIFFSFYGQAQAHPD